MEESACTRALEKETARKGGREGGKDEGGGGGGRKGGREAGRQGGREAGREGGRDGGKRERRREGMQGERPSIGAGANVPRSGVVANVAGLLALGVVSRQFVEAAAGTRRKSKPCAYSRKNIVLS